MKDYLIQFKMENSRKITLKTYIPFKVINSKEKLVYVKDLLEKLYIKMSEER